MSKADFKYEELSGKLVRFFRFKNVSDPENLSQEVILRLTERLKEHTKSPILEVEHYAFAIARNLIANESQKESHLEFREDLPEISSQNDILSDFIENETKQLEMICLEKCLSSLSPDSRELLLSYYRERTFFNPEEREKLAARMGMSPSSARVMVHRLKSRLRSCIEDCLKNR
jgi:RNA polymerase sigma factor (sigma-70 family)